MEAQVAALVYAAEEEAIDSKLLSESALKNSRYWLLAISFVSLMAAILVVWLFVIGYIVARLRELTRGMVAVSKGRLDTPIPARTPDELGDMSGALAVFRDNAREIHVAREQAEAARLMAEAASRTKSAFLANMSHELRTPLNAIIGYSEILHEDAADRGDTASQADLVKIQSAGKHLLGLINDILDLSKIESGRMDIHLEDVDLGKLVSEVRVLVAPLMDKNANTLQVEMPADIGMMRVDMVKLKQSLINLLSNAAKFTKQGIVTLGVRRVAGSVKFAVSDSGIGMSDEQVGRLFQAFTQADATTTRNYGGTGLGLTITKHFCTMLGGTIGVTSKPDEGSTFTITLPDSGVREQATIPAAEAPRISGAVSGKTVLVVDDDPAVHDVLRQTLVKEGYRLLHAYDGIEALQIAKDDHARRDDAAARRLDRARKAQIRSGSRTYSGHHADDRRRANHGLFAWRGGIHDQTGRPRAPDRVAAALRGQVARGGDPGGRRRRRRSQHCENDRRKGGIESRRGPRWTRRARLAGGQFPAGADPARPDDAGDGRLRVSGKGEGHLRPEPRSDRGPDGEGPDASRAQCHQ